MSWLKQSVMDIYYNRQCTYVSGCRWIFCIQRRKQEVFTKFLKRVVARVFLEKICSIGLTKERKESFFPFVVRIVFFFCTSNLIVGFFF